MLAAKRKRLIRPGKYKVVTLRVWGDRPAVVLRNFSSISLLTARNAGESVAASKRDMDLMATIWGWVAANLEYAVPSAFGVCIMVLSSPHWVAALQRFMKLRSEIRKLKLENEILKRQLHPENTLIVSATFEDVLEFDPKAKVLKEAADRAAQALRNPHITMWLFLIVFLIGMVVLYSTGGPAGDGSVFSRALAAVARDGAHFLRDIGYFFWGH